jgi:hypothetical protein
MRFPHAQKSGLFQINIAEPRMRCRGWLALAQSARVSSRSAWQHRKLLMSHDKALVRGWKLHNANQRKANKHNALLYNIIINRPYCGWESKTYGLSLSSFCSWTSILHCYAKVAFWQPSNFIKSYNDMAGLVCKEESVQQSNTLTAQICQCLMLPATSTLDVHRFHGPWWSCHS